MTEFYICFMTTQAKEFLLSLLAYSAQRGIVVEKLCALAEVNPEALLEYDFSEVTAEKVERLWKYASQKCDDPLFGLHFGESLQIAALGVVGEIIKSSNTVGEALQVAMSLVPLVTDRFTMELSNKRSTSTISLIPIKLKANPEFVNGQMADFLMAFTIHELDGLLLKKLKPEEVTMPKIPSQESEYKRVYRCDYIKEAPQYSISLRQKLLDAPIITRNYQAQQMLLEKTNLTTGKWPPKTAAFNARVQKYLDANSYLKVPTLEETAANFNMSPRTLQRKLKEEGKTFQQIAEAVKKQIAIRYMSTASYPIKEISYILGYNDYSAFSRAFKRWTGKAPIDYN